MKKVIRSTVSVILSVLMIFGMFSISFAYNASSPFVNSRWKKTNRAAMESKYNKGETFVLVVSNPEDAYTGRTNDLFNSWMIDRGVDVYNISAYEDETDNVPDWVWENLDVPDGIYVSPVVVFVKNKRITEYDWCDSYDKYAKLEKAFNSLYGTHDNVVSISVNFKPEKVVYEVGDAFDPRGFVLKVTYADGTKENVYEGYTFSGFSSKEEGIKNVTVSYKGQKDSFQVVVSGTQSYFMNVRYYQTDARSMLGMINEFRTGGNAWYWSDPISGRKTKVTGLKPLTYDYTLEKVAMQRAAELAVLYSHDRPDGTNNSTAYEGMDFYEYSAENISSNLLSAGDAFTEFLEENKSYDEQGHRRSMLDTRYTNAGIACAYVNGIKFWVMIFGTPAKNAPPAVPETAPENGEIKIPVDILNTNLTVRNITMNFPAAPYVYYNGTESSKQPKTVEIQKGDTFVIPSIDAMIKTGFIINSNGDYLYFPLTVNEEWMSSDMNVVTVENGVVTTHQGGNASIYVGVGSEVAVIDIAVIDNEPTASEIRIKSKPTKTTYTVGESFEQRGLVLTVKYADGSTKDITGGFTCTGFNSSTAGTKTITVTYGGKSTTFTVTVNEAPAAALSSISVKTKPSKTTYTIGESFNSSGLVLTAKYSDGSTKDITSGFTCTGFSSTTAGTKTITVTYGGKSTTFTVTVNAAPVTLSSISVKTKPSKTTYTIGESFNQSGLVLTAKYSDGSTKDITSGFTCTGFNSSTAGTKTITVTYGGKTATFTVTVNAVLSSISVKTKPSKTTYTIGESFNSSGLVLTAKYSDGSTKDITTGYACDGFNSTTAGTKTITVTYGGKSTTFTVTVNAVLSSISVKTKPSKTDYLVGESFSQSGLVITAKYSDGSTKDITSGFTCTGFSSTTAGTKTITVTYGGKSTTFDVTVNVDPNAPKIEIVKYVKSRELDYKSTISFSCEVPSGCDASQIHWFIDGKDKGTGSSYKVEKAKNNFTVQAKLIKGGGVISETEIESLTVKHGFFDRFIAFFRGLFGSLPKIDQSAGQ